MSSTPRQPVIFLPHGGGPWTVMDMSAFGPKAQYEALERWLRELPGTLPAPPRALLVISAHWEERRPTLQTAAAPPMFYDYYGFPPHTYTLQWPAPGAPELAEQARALLEGAGIPAAADPARGFDHGTFVPLMLSWPQAQVPTAQLSLQVGLDPAAHLAIGRALAPLRDQGVLLLGSGLSYHNMQGFFGRLSSAAEDAVRFDDWLAETVQSAPALREQRLVEWARAPRARACHPREEHLLPLMVVAGAAGEDPASLPFRAPLMGAQTLAARFG